jgi:hypothetical protein
MLALYCKVDVKRIKLFSEAEQEVGREQVKNKRMAASAFVIPAEDGVMVLALCKVEDKRIKRTNQKKQKRGMMLEGSKVKSKKRSMFANDVMLTVNKVKEKWLTAVVPILAVSKVKDKWLTAVVPILAVNKVKEKWLTAVVPILAVRKVKDKWLTAAAYLRKRRMTVILAVSKVEAKRTRAAARNSGSS